jgi:hypothetical protein
MTRQGVPSVDSCETPSNEQLRTLADIVEHYVREKRPLVNRERAFFKKLSFDKAVEFAGLAKRADGKRHSHQRRLKQKVLDKCERRLQQVSKELAQSQSFAELHNVIKGRIGEIVGVGVLTVYDMANNIGANLGLEPEEVYLHAGTRKGAKLVGLGLRQHKLPRNVFPKELQRLKPREIEDCLCSYADHIARTQ